MMKEEKILAGRRAAEQAGVEFVGIQDSFSFGNPLLLFNDPVTHTTLSVENFTAEAITQRMKESRAKILKEETIA